MQGHAIFCKRSFDFQFFCVRTRQRRGALARRLGLGSCYWTRSWARLGLKLSLRLLSGAVLLRDTLLPGTGVQLGASTRLA